jgi:hypothetical protein
MPISFDYDSGQQALNPDYGLARPLPSVGMHCCGVTFQVLGQLRARRRRFADGAERCSFYIGVGQNNQLDINSPCATLPRDQPNLSS